MNGTGSAEIIPLELGTFAFPADELPGLRGGMAYLVRHRGGLLLFDTGFGFGNAELEARYQPRAVRVSNARRSVGVDPAEIDAVANCHLHADHAELDLSRRPRRPSLLHRRRVAGEGTPLEGRSAAPDVAACDRSIARLRDLGSDVVRFGHDRAAWTPNPST